MALSTQRIDLGKASFEYLLETGNIPEALELRLGAIETVARHYRQDLEAAKLSSAALGAVGLALSINPLVAVLAGIGVFGYGYTVLQDFYHTKRFCPLPLLRKTTGDLLTGIGLSATGDNLEDDPLSGVIGYVEPDLAHEYELLMVAEGQLVNYLHSLPPEKRLPAYRHMLRYTKLRNHSLELPELQDVATALGGVEVKPNAGLKAQEARSKKLESVEEHPLQDNNNALSQWLTETQEIQANRTIDVPALEIDQIEEQPLPLHPDVLINQIIQIILKCLAERGASCDFLEVVDTPKFRRVLLRKAAKTKVSAVLGTSEDLFCELGSVLPNLNVHPLISMVKGGRISVDIAKSKAEWSTAYFKNYIVPGTRSFESPILLPIGIDMDGILKEIDLSADETCGLLVGGVTGGGKSMWATSSIAALICQYTPDSLRLVLSDTKKVEFRPFANIPHLFSPVATDVPSTVSCLKLVCIERERRETLFAQAKVRNLAQYNLQVAPSDRLPRIVVFIEETKTAVESKEVYTEYNDDGREITISYSERFQYYKDEIKRLARASGIYLIDSTQSPRQEVLPAGYRGQFSAFLAFRVSRPEESKIALANQYEDACKLLGKGDALYLDNMGLERVQALYLEPEEVEAIVNRVIATYGSYKPHPLVSSNLEQNDPEPEWKRLEKLLDVPYDGKKEVVEQLPSDRPTPPSESPELDPDWEAFQKIKNGRKEAVETEGGRKKIGRKSKTQLCQEIFGCSDGGRGLKAASIEYERIRDKFAHLWIRDLLDKGMSKSKIIEEIYSINVLSQDKFRKNKPEEWKQISELIDLLADELNYEPEEEVGDE